MEVSGEGDDGPLDLGLVGGGGGLNEEGGIVGGEGSQRLRAQLEEAEVVTGLRGKGSRAGGSAVGVNGSVGGAGKGRRHDGSASPFKPSL